LFYYSLLLSYHVSHILQKKRKVVKDSVSSTKKKSSPMPALDPDSEPLPLKGGDSMSSRGRLRTPSRKARLLTENDLEDMYNDADADFEDEYEESVLEVEEEEDDQVGANKKKRANSSPPNGNRKKYKGQRCLLTKAAKLESGLYKETGGRLMKLCSVDGCGSFAKQGGVCIRHGAKLKPRKQRPKLCSVEGCGSFAKKGGVCVRHGAKLKPRKLCSVEGCGSFAKQGGVCIRHGAKRKPRKMCSIDWCTKHAHAEGKCYYHGPNGRGRNVHLFVP